MAKRIALMSEKGGVGKTTLTVNLAAALAPRHRVLVVDADQQGNASDLLLDCAPGDAHAADLSAVLLGKASAADAIQPSVSAPGVFLITAGKDLAHTQVELTNLPGRDLRLRHALDDIDAEWDYMLIDCPPGRGLLAIAALAAADSMLIPMDPSRDGLMGVNKAIELGNDVRRYIPNQRVPGAPGVLGVVINRVARNKTHADCVANMQKTYGPLLLACIPNAVSVDTAGWAAKPVVLSEPASAPSKAISDLAKRIASNVAASAA